MCIFTGIISIRTFAKRIRLNILDGIIRQYVLWYTITWYRYLIIIFPFDNGFQRHYRVNLSAISFKVNGSWANSKRIYTFNQRLNITSHATMFIQSNPDVKVIVLWLRSRFRGRLRIVIVRTSIERQCNHCHNECIK